MKKTTLLALPFLFLIALALSVGAEPAIQNVDVEATAAVADAAETERVEASLEWPLRPGFLTVETSWGSCTECSSHSECGVVCGGFGACLADFGTECGSDREKRYCFCN